MVSSGSIQPRHTAATLPAKAATNHLVHLPAQTLLELTHLSDEDRPQPIFLDFSHNSSPLICYASAIFG